MQVTLTVTAGPGSGREFTFAEHDNFIVGRSPAAHFRLPRDDRYFSRVHFMVEVNPPHCLLMDMASTNGTYVNGQRVQRAHLCDGDTIRGGRTIIQVAIRDGQPGQPGDSASLATPNPPIEPVRPGATLHVPDGDPRQPAEPLDEAARDAPATLSIPGYTIVGELGRGGMGVVYQAIQQSTGAMVAVKTIRPAVAGSLSVLQRFVREAEILRQLQHPHIVAYGDMGTFDGNLYFVMEYVPGCRALDLLRSEGPLPVPRAVGIICQTLEALEYAHNCGFVHRDVKPANLLVTQCDGRLLVKLTDFGLARMYQSSTLSGLTLMGQVSGTLAYMAPEQISSFREAHPPVDQYSAAASLYHLLTGHYIYDFPAETARKILMILQERPVPLLARRPDLPEELAEVVHRGLKAAPEERSPHCGFMREALLPWLR